MVEQVQERHEVHVLYSVVSIGLVNLCGSVAGQLSCKQNSFGSISGGGMQGWAASVALF